MKEISRRQFLGIGAGAVSAAVLGLCVKGLGDEINGMAAEQRRSADEQQKTLTTAYSEPSRTGWQIAYPAREPQTVYLPEEKAAVMPINGEVMINGQATDVYITNYEEPKKTYVLALNIMSPLGKANEHVVGQTRDKKADTAVVAFRHKQAINYVKLQATEFQGNSPTQVKTTRMGKYRGYA